MREALALAAEAGLAGLDVPVGAVILGPDGAIVARAHNQREEQRDPTAHAEIVALRAAAAAAGGWTGTRSWSPSNRARCVRAR